MKQIHFQALAVLFVSFALLMFEIIQTVTLSLQIFHTNAFLVISLSMFGLGGGGSLANLLMRKGLANSPGWLWKTSMAFAASLVIASVLCSRASDLFALIAIGFWPYLFAGLLISVVFQRSPQYAGRIYCFNLVGSGLGCAAVILFLDGLGDAGLALLLVGETALLGSLFLAKPLSRQAVATTLILVGAVGALLPVSNELFEFRPAEYKAYGRLLGDPEKESSVHWSKWGYLGRLDSVIPGKGIENFGYSGDWVYDPEASGSAVRLLFASGDNWSTTIDFGDDDDFRNRFTREMVPAAPYIFFDKPDVLNIGVGGGVDLFLALRSGARSVTGVEINPLMIEAVCERHREFMDNPCGDKRVSIEQLDGRTFVDGTDSTFDVITLTAVDTGAGLGAGAYVLSENYLYTEQAFDAYLDVLKPQGVLFAYRPGLDLVRIIVTAVASLRKLGVEDPEKHIAVFGGQLWIGAIISKSPLSPDQTRLLAGKIGSGDFGKNIYFTPDRAVAPNRFTRLFSEIKRDNEAEVVKSARQTLGLDFSPVSDDRPFFYQLETGFFSSSAGRLLTKILLIVVGMACLLIVAPLLVGGGLKTGGGFLLELGYFFSIGIGFMLVELALIQKLVLFLGHPSYSLVVTLFTILVFSGLGSLIVDRLSNRMKRLPLAGILVAVLAAGFYALFLTSVLDSLHSRSLLKRAMVAIVILAPGSTAMGIPFPSMIRSLTGKREILVSWSWAVNSMASVVASIAAVMISMTQGFSVTLLIGAAFYLLALCFFALHLRRPEQSAGRTPALQT